MLSCGRHLRSVFFLVFFLMIRRPPRSTLDRSSAASDVYKRQEQMMEAIHVASAIRGGASLVHGTQMMAKFKEIAICLLYTSPSPRDRTRSRMPSSA